MHPWHLTHKDPISLTIAADQRFSQLDHENDHVWELTLGDTNLRFLALHTSFGLCARAMRLFPQFRENNQLVTNPEHFHSPPAVVAFTPNYIKVETQPFKDLSVSLEYCSLESRLVSGRVIIENKGDMDRQISFRMAAMLLPMGCGQSMKPFSAGMQSYLKGKTDDLHPVFLMSAGPVAVASPYLALSVNIHLVPSESRYFIWSCASENNPEASYQIACKAINRDWDAELTRLELLNQAQSIEIYTGDINWDAALAFSQKQAFSLLRPADSKHPYANPISTRSPDSGHGKVNGTTVISQSTQPIKIFQLFQLVQTLLPANPLLVKGLILNFISNQAENGAIPWKTDASPESSSYLAPPLLASIAWQIFEQDHDRAFIETVFAPLCQSLQPWFDDNHDRDQDGLPEWQGWAQTGLESSPLFDPFLLTGNRLRIETVESPGLMALLAEEIASLIKIAKELDQSGGTRRLKKQYHKLANALKRMYQPGEKTYCYWDRDTHLTPQLELLLESNYLPMINIHKKFGEPQRLLISLYASDDSPRVPSLSIKGLTSKGQPLQEVINSRRIFWYLGRATITTEKAFSQLESIEIDGLQKDDQLDISTTDLTALDITCLLPLRSHLLTGKQAQDIASHQQSLDGNEYPYGIPEWLLPVDESTSDGINIINMPWNLLILQGLLMHGLKTEALDLFSRLMGLTIHTLKTRHAFFECYDAKSGKPIGSRHALTGILPITFFLQLSGIQIHSPKKVRITGDNAFPWPVTVKYCGLIIQREGKSTRIQMPDGQVMRLFGSASHLIEQA